ncbi:MAG: InlB B-repeat-containing protein [Spirochaetia bacterium]|nr:InlB B-repeat-containing protein [Spirochaetia bacterium]
MKRRMLILLSVIGLLMAGCPETTPTSVTIKFDANGGTGTMKEMVVDSGAETVLTPNAFARDGFTFKGWNDSKDGKGKAYADKAKVKPTADMTLFAQWEVKKVDITFNNNPPAGSDEPISETKQTVPVGQEVILDAPDVKIEGYNLLGWAKDRTAETNEYSNGGKITVSEALTLYAVWQPVVAGEVVITFDGNGADEGSVMEPQTVSQNTSVILKPNQFSKTGYTFRGWTTNSAGTEVMYSDEAEITVNTENITLYAVWQAEEGGEEPTPEPENNVFGINNDSNTIGTYENGTVTLQFKKTGGDWTWPADVAVMATKDNIAVENITLNQENNTLTISDTLAAGVSVTYIVTFSAEGYDSLTLTWAVTVENAISEIPAEVTVTLLPSDRLISGETVMVAPDDTGIDGVTIATTVNVTGGVTESLSLLNSAFTVPTVENVTENVTLTFTLQKTDCTDAERTVTVKIYPATYVRYDGKIFSLTKGFDFTQTAEVPGTKVATSTDYNNRTAITGAADGYHFNNADDTRIYLELQGVSFDLMTVNLKWASGGQPNFVFHGADGGTYGYQFYKAVNSNKGWFLNGGWNTNGEGLSATYNPAPVADVFHTFRVCDQGNNNRSSQLDDAVIVRYSFTNNQTLSTYTATRDNGNGMFVQFGNDGNGGTDKRNFTVKAISFYSEVTE